MTAAPHPDPMKAVLDTSALLEGFEPSPPGDFVVPPSVVDEVSRGRAGRRLENLLAAGLGVREAGEANISRVGLEVQRMGEEARLSRTDIEVLALALELGLPVVTDDYSIQNVAACLGVDTMPFKQRGIVQVWRWGVRCPGCRRWFEEAPGPECPVCGTGLRTARRG